MPLRSLKFIIWGLFEVHYHILVSGYPQLALSKLHRSHHRHHRHHRHSAATTTTTPTTTIITTAPTAETAATAAAAAAAALQILNKFDLEHSSGDYLLVGDDHATTTIAADSSDVVVEVPKPASGSMDVTVRLVRRPPNHDPS